MRDAATSGLTVRSGAGKTATTPRAARAAAPSIDTMRACACSLRRNATCSAFGVCRSSTKLPRPVSRRGSSVRFTRAPMIFGLASITSLIDVGALAQRLPLLVVVAANDRRAARFDAADFSERLHQSFRVPDIARQYPGIERGAQRHGIGGEQKLSVPLQRPQRAHRSRRVTGQRNEHDAPVAEQVALALHLVERQSDVPFAAKEAELLGVRRARGRDVA